MKIIDKENFVFPKVKDYKKEYINLDRELPQGTVLDKYPRPMDSFPLDSSAIEEFKGENGRFLDLARKSYNSAVNLLIPKGAVIKDPVKVDFNLDEENPTLINYNTIVAEEDSQGTLIIDYRSEEGLEGFHNGLTMVYAKRNSVINIIKIQRMGDQALNFDSNIGITEANGRINWISIEIGGSITSSNFSSYLRGEASESNLSSIYLGDGDRKLDLDYNMVHMGPRSISNIDTKGVLKDRSRKMFKGNLDFRQGSRLSQGVEEEYVILLDPRVKSDSIPALLSHEDDVIGEHAASAGQISEDKLFYLMSRGLDENRAKKLIVEASFRPVINQIPFENLRAIISQEVERRLIDEDA